jgi:hypothetical protein
VIQALLRYTSIVVSAIVVLSFAMFATDQSRTSSANEVRTIGNESSTSASQQQQQQPQQQSVPKPAKPHGQPRQAIDDADNQILKPFNGVVSSSTSEWVKKGVPSLLALVVFGFLLNLLAGYMPKPQS